MLYHKLSAPITCQIEITNVCNNNCIHCYNHWRHINDGARNHMDTETLQLVIAEIIKNKIFQVTFTGGETFLNRSILFRGLSELTQAGVACSVNSNLTTFTIDDGIKIYDLGLRGILTSVSSFDPQKHDLIMQRRGAFNDVLSGIRIAIQSGLKVGCSMVVTSLNIDDVLDTGRFLHNIGVSQFFATKASPPLNAKNFQQYMISKKQLLQVIGALNSLREECGIEVGVLECYPLCFYLSPVKYPFLKDRKCSAGITTCTIGVDAEVRPCSHSDESYGNIHDTYLSNIWSNMRDNRDGSKLPYKCLDCSKLSQCSGGCRVDAKYCYGHYNNFDPYANPNDVDRIEECETSLPNVSDETVFRISNDLKIRIEELGVLIATAKNIARPVFVTFDTLDLIQHFSKVRFTIQDVCEFTALNDVDGKQICRLLLRDKILELDMCI